MQEKKKSSKAETAKENVEGVKQSADDLQSTSESTFYKFENLKLRMEDAVWYMDMLLDKSIPKLYMYYKMKWVVDLSEVETFLEEIKRDRDDYVDSLLEEEDQKIKDNFSRREASVLETKAQMIKDYENIEFFVSVEQMKNKPDHTQQITFKIPSEAIAQLNSHRADAEKYYKFCLLLSSNE